MGCASSTQVQTVGTATSKALEDSQHGNELSRTPKAKKASEDDSSGSEYETDSDENNESKPSTGKKETTFDHGNEPDDVAQIEGPAKRKASKGNRRSSLDDMIDELDMDTKKKPPGQSLPPKSKSMSKGSLDDAVDDIMSSGNNLATAKEQPVKSPSAKAQTLELIKTDDKDDDMPPPAKRAFGDGKGMNAKDIEKEKKREEKEARDRDKAAAKARTKELKGILSEKKKKEKELAKVEKDFEKRKEKALRKGETIPDDDPSIAAIDRLKETIASLDADAKAINGMQTGVSGDELNLSMNSNFSNSGNGTTVLTGGSKLNGHVRSVASDGRSSPESVASTKASPVKKAIAEDNYLPGMIDDPMDEVDL
eukprot:Opistho-2@4551